jgi:hypothetical protein
MKPLIAAARAVQNSIRLFLLAQAALLSFFAFPASAQIVNLKVLREFQAQGQQFSCDAQYLRAKCAGDLDRLLHLLERYGARSLGQWQWVIVSRTEWKPLCAKLGADPLSPAMTSFLDGQTFFDEALFHLEPLRTSELFRKFGVPWKELLPLAVTHELGHAACRDSTEIRAESFAGRLRQHLPGSCDLTAEVSLWRARGSTSGN